MNDIIRMAREAGIGEARGWFNCVEEELERFAALVAAAERNRIWTQSHWTEYERSIVAAEREACAQILDSNAEACKNNSMLADVLIGNALAIRARGEK